MTVRVNKSAFNIREKLSELERPIGVKGNELMRAETAQDARDFISAGRKNLVINGDFKVWQRGTSGGVGNGNRTYLSADRWFNFNAGDSTSRVDVSNESIGGVTGRFEYALEIGGVQNSRILGQCIEGPLPAGDYVFSAWVKFSKIPTNPLMTHNATALSSKNNFNGFYGGSGTSVSYDSADNMDIISQPNVWYHIYKKFTPVNPNLGLGIAFQPLFATNTNATMTVTGVQVELGKNATEFEHRSYGEELALCQRYYLQFGYNSNLNRLIWTGDVTTGNTYYLPIQFPVEMRSEPTVAIQNYSNSGFSLVGPQTRRTHCRVLANCTSTGARRYFEFDMTADAEL